MGGREIGAAGTCVRIGLGAFLLVFGAIGGRLVLGAGRPQTRLDLTALLVGLLILPAIFLVGLWLRSLREATPLMATGPFATALNLGLIVVLLATASIAPISFLGFGAMVFYGATMLLAAALGYAGCEVTTVSNWLLRRHDQLGCPVLGPVDALDHR